MRHKAKLSSFIGTTENFSNYCACGKRLFFLKKLNALRWLLELQVPHIPLNMIITTLTEVLSFAID